ncbi:deoxyribonuclease IV [Paenibacillus thalictri]|uniref:Deoxyribonuclease IV n=1 Tax=Paenibacillus thalictri TaxID=2527873 RepID=A0A4Q9DTH6_9BACL|nr:deoxyribonuclease IV [Paenibacillus thalictri]TBL80236.1 deoxyribonuclease IV [Paenibacillus thalictri]
MRVGCHISIRGGYLEAAKTALRIGAQSFQYFPKNPRSLSVKAFNRGDAESCALFCKEHRLASIAHTPYPTNLAADEPGLREATRLSLLNDLEIAEACGSVGIIVHFGKYKGTDALQGYKNIIQLLNDVTAGWNGRTLLLIENQAGEGTFMGTTFEEHMQIRSLVNEPEKVGFCLDTCHAFASGLWRGDNWRDVAAKGAALGYFSHLKAVHLNDSQYGTGSHKDRHAGIGQGAIGLQHMAQFLQSDRIASGLPVVLETPVPRGGTHAEEIALVRKLAEIPHP